MKHTHGPWSLCDKSSAFKTEARLQILKVNIGLEIQYLPIMHAAQVQSPVPLKYKIKLIQS